MEAQLAQLQQQLEALHAEHAATVQQLQVAQQQLAAAAAQPGQAAQHLRLKMPKPPVFSGLSREPTPQNWAHQMESYLQGNDVLLDTPQAATYAAGYLSGAALTWYRLHLAEVARGAAVPFLTWSDFRNALITRFTPISPERTAREKLSILRQRNSVRAYAQEYNLCMLELADMSEKDRIFRFLEGLKPDVRIHVELQNPNTLAEAVELAIKADSLVWQVKKGNSGFKPTPFIPRGGGPRYPGANQFSGPSPMELGAMDASKRFDRSKRDSSKEERKCFVCKRPGHLWRQCPQRRRQQQPRPGNQQSN